MADMKCPSVPDHACDVVSLGEFIDRSGMVGKIEVVRCRRCGHGRTLPALDDVGFLYVGRESQDFQPSTGGLSFLIKSIAFRLSARKLLRQIGMEPARLLDFGCGSGLFTDELAKELPSGAVVGSDFFADPPRANTRFSYRSLADLQRSAETFDTVISMHVLEHAESSGELLADIARHVKPGGILVIEVPNAACMWGSVFGKYWDGWYVPFHRHHFSRTSLRNLLEQSGLEIVAEYNARVPTMGRTFRNLLGGKGELVWLLAGIIAHPAQLLGEILTGEPSALRVVVRKPAT